MAGRPRGRKRGRTKRRPTPKLRQPRGFLLSVSSDGQVLDASLPVNRPDNWALLGVKPFLPPVKAPFYTKTSAEWSTANLRTTLDALLRKVGHRSARACAIKVAVRYGEEDDNGGVIYSSAKEGGGMTFYSDKFSEAKGHWQFEHFDHKKKRLRKPLPPWPKLAQWHLADFVDRFVSKDRGRYNATAYIYRLGVALLYNKRHFKQPRRRVERGAWARQVAEYKRQRR